MQNIILDLELAREIELAEAQAAVGCTEMMKTVQAETIGAFEAIAGGYAAYCGANNPVTQAVALGLSGPVTAEDFDRLEAFYFSRNEPVRVETCPLADVTLLAHFKERRYHVSEFSNVMVRRLSGEETPWPAAPPDPEIRQVSREDIDLWVLTVAQGFAENYPVTQELLSVMKMFALGKNTACYLASIDGRIAGGATLAIRGRIGGLFGASTLPEFRKRGIQTALLYARFRRAQEAGCEFVMSLAQPGSISQRNITRLGLQTLYTRVKFERPLPSDGASGS
jgi:GNAT superfamily N-acetyltransferase